METQSWRCASCRLVNPSEASACRRCSAAFSPSISSKPPAPAPAPTPSVPPPAVPAENAAPFERHVVGPLVVGIGQHPLLSFIFPRYFYCVCLEDGLIFVPRPWILGIWPFRLAAVAACCALLVHLLFNESPMRYRYPLVPVLPLVAAGVCALLVPVLFVYRFAGESAYCKWLAGLPPREIPGRDGPSHVDLATVRSLKTNSWRLLLVREGEEDFAFRIPFLVHGDVEWALGKAYPGLWKRES